MRKRSVLSLAGAALLIAGIGAVSYNIVAQKSTLRTTSTNAVIERLPELDAALRLQTVLRSIATNITPGVVSIEVEGSVAVNSMAQDPFFRFFFGNDEQRRRQYSSMGSGFIITPDGYLFSNWHVVQDASRIRVVLSDGRSFDAKVIGADTELDVALLKIDATDLPVVPLGNSDDVQVGDFVVAIGNPFGLSGTFTFGTVSALGREGLLPGLQRFIQTDVAVNPGNSGGPLLNLRGQAVALNTAIRSQSGGYEGISFAIPINAIKDVADQLFQKGSIERGYLGLVPQSLDSVTRRSLRLDEKEGVLISSLEPKGPAEKAGLRQGDIITKVDGVTVSSPPDLTSIVASKAPRSSVELEVVRNGNRQKLIITLGVRPNNIVRGNNRDSEPQPGGGSPGGASSVVTFLDVTFGEPTAAELRRSGAESGVIVRNIATSSKLAFALNRGDIVAAVNNQQIINLQDIKKFTDENGGTRAFAFAVYRNGFLVYRSVEF
ncbi:MAG: Do family serine endopeptidase [Brevinema sp.]